MANDARDDRGDGGTETGRVLERVTPEDVPVLYANNVQVTTSLFDVVLDLGIIVHSTPERVVVRDVAKVALSPQHAKVLTEILVRRLGNYEQSFGKIPRTPDSESASADSAPQVP